MPKVIVLPHQTLCPEGEVLEGKTGESICRTLLAGHVALEHACEMSCACTTCHVVVREGFDSLNEINETEEDLLDSAWGLEQLSRLSCQAMLGTQDVTIEIPKYTLNIVREAAPE